MRGEARLAPVYDIVTTSVYLPRDSMALTLNRSTRWPTAKHLRRLGETRGSGTPARIAQTLHRVAQAIQDTMGEVRLYIREHPEFTGVGERMLREWDSGIRNSLVG